MNEEEVIIDIEIDNSGAVASTKSLTAAIVDQTAAIKKTTDATKALEKENKDLEKTNKQLEQDAKKGKVAREDANKQIEANNKAIDTNNAKIKQNRIDIIGQKDALSKTRAERKTSIKTMETESNSLNALRARNKDLRKEQANVNLSTKQGQKRLKEINTEINKNDKAIKKNSDSLSQQKQNIGNYKSALEGVPGPIGMIQKGFNMLLVNPIFAILAGLVITLKMLKDAFSRSADGQNALAKGMGFLKGLVVVLERAFDKLAEVVIGAFQNPKKAIADLWDFIKTNLINRLTGMVDVFKNLGELIANVFTGKFDKIGESAKKVGQSIIQATTGLDVEQQAKTWEKLNGAMQDVNQTMENSIALEEKRLGLRRTDIAAITQLARLETQIAVARAEASDKLLDTETRLKAIDKAEEKVKQKLDLQLHLAQRRLQVKRLENSLSKTGLDDREEEAQLAAEVIKLEGARATELRAFIKLRATTIDELADKEIKAIQATAKAGGKSREDSLKALVKGFSELLESEDLTARKRVDIEKLRSDAVNALALADEAKRKKLAERDLKATEKVAEIETKVRQKVLLSSLEGTALFFKKKQEFLDQDFATEQEKLTASLEAGLITEEEHFAALLELQTEFNDQAVELDKDRRETLREVDEADFEGRLELEDLRFQEAQDRLDAQLAAELITAKEHKDALEDLEEEHSKKIEKIQEAKIRSMEKNAKDAVNKFAGIEQAALTVRFNRLEKAHRKELAAFHSRNGKELADLQAKFDAGLLDQAEFDEAKTALDEKFKKKEKSLAEKQAKEKYKLELKAFKLNKAAALAQIAIDMAATISKAILATPLTFGLPFSAINLASQVAQAAVVASTPPPPPPTFAEGGQVIKGKSHAAGGEDIHVGGRLVGNMQGGEGLFVTKREATAEALSSINQSYGGRSFAGTNKTFFQEGGSAVPISNVGPETLKVALSEALRDLPTPVVQVEDVQNGIESREETLAVRVV